MVLVQGREGSWGTFACFMNEAAEGVPAQNREAAACPGKDLMQWGAAR